MPYDPASRPAGKARRPRQAPAAVRAPRGQKRRRARLPRAITLLGRILMLMGILLIAGLWARSYFFVRPSEKKLEKYLAEGTFLNGIHIDGTNVSGMTIEEARQALLPGVEAAADAINIGVRYNTSLWLFNAVDLGAQSDLDQVLAEAMLLGRGDTPAENKKARNDLADNGKAYSTNFTADSALLAARVAAIGQAIDTLPSEPFATPILFWDAAAGDMPSFSYTDGKDGYMLNESALVQEILACLASGDHQAILTPELDLTPPTTTLEQVQANTQLRAAFQTDFSSRSARNTNRVGNIQKATTILNGAEILPGETLDFNEFIGPRYESGGWPLAPGIVNGDRYEMQPGGGICQVSTTLYIALLRAGAMRSDVEATAQEALAAPINITERNNHSWPSAYADRGLDATVSTGGKNLVFINQMDTPLYIFAYCDQENYKMNIYIYGQPLPDGLRYEPEGVTVEELEPGETQYTDNPNWPTGYEKVDAEGRVGYVAEVYMNVYQDDELISRELLYTDKYRAVTEKITRGTGDPSLPVPEEE